MNGATPAGGVLDAHVHVWAPSRLAYPWLRDEPALDRDFGPDDVDDADGAITEWVFVEADSSAPLDEVAWVSGLAWPGLRAIVAKVDLRHPRLDELTQAPLVRGVRHLLQDQRITEDLLPGLRAAGERGLTFDATVRWPQLDALAALLAAAPGTPTVLDHLGKPPVRMGLDSAEGQEWRRSIHRIAALPHVQVKLSGLPAEGGLGHEFLEETLEAFGSERCLFGGDWPVSGVPGAGTPVADALAAVRSVTSDERVFGANARAFYGV
ncbi:amidohydrolase family protein [Microbacterium stercoris]|uniref:Amidohydrolase family protein n=1 Tax=Microbacterium stercoris TaxID=2820289 RepID=A0A939QNU5_9MICO|nr:amidohydrolase family protein [Microbacterium stercoris]MBO3662841.1 amidohydrolase family protein [Microbacterium stercoris]